MEPTLIDSLAEAMETTQRCPYEGCTQAWKDKDAFRGPYAKLHYKGHVRQHMGLKMYPCPRDGCKEEFVGIAYVLSHIKKMHMPVSDIHVCKLGRCGKKFRKAHLLLYHMKKTKHDV
jgi:hypothetical protein